MPRRSALRICGQRMKGWQEGHGESVYWCGRNDYANNGGNLSHGELAG